MTKNQEFLDQCIAIGQPIPGQPSGVAGDQMGKFYTQTNLQIDDKQAYRVFDGKKQARLGTEKNPAVLCVQTEERRAELEREFLDNGWFCQIQVDEEAAEDTSALQLLKDTPKTSVLEKLPGRNDPCLCGSGKKYKKCCG